jgi:hypothetical protein
MLEIRKSVPGYICTNFPRVMFPGAERAMKLVHM